ncbi:MAG: ATP-binding protein [Halolamina sp.]
MAAYQLVWLFTLLAVPTAFALFGFAYHGLELFDTALRRAAFVAPAAVSAAAGTVLSVDTGSIGAGGRLLTPALRGRVGTASGMTPTAMQAPVTTLFGVQPVSLPTWAVNAAVVVQDFGVYYVSGVSLVAGGLLVRSVLRYRHLDTGLGANLAFVGLWPWVAYGAMPVVATLFSWTTALTGTVAGYAASLAAVVVAVGRYGLLDSDPAAGNVGSRTVLAELADPVFALDDRGTVLRLNPAAEETFGVSEREAVGRSLSTVVGTDVERLRRDDAVELETVGGRRRFETTRSAIGGRDGGTRGETVVLTDVTRRRTRRQRLEVLTRVLRHNLRNDITVIRGHAALIGDGGVDDPTDNAATIREMSDRLISISERAREAQRVVASGDDAGVETEVGALVQRVHETVAETYPGAELSTAVPDDVVARVDATTLEIVLTNVVENACEHNDSTPPIVVTSVERTDDGTVQLLTRDNGPGIPETEQRVVEEGVEDPLEHGSGMGLWTVKWGVTQMGGSLSFGDATPRGTVVRLDIPAVES